MGLMQVFGGLIRSLYSIPSLLIDLAIGTYLIFDGVYSYFVARKYKETRANLSRYARIGAGASYNVAALKGVLSRIGASITRKLMGAYMLIDGIVSLYYGLKKKTYSNKVTNALRITRTSMGGFTLLYL